VPIASSAPARAADETPASAMPKPTEAPKFLAASDLKGEFRTVVRDEKEAWRELAPLWALDVGAGEPCDAAQRQQVRCFKAAASLDLVRKLGRPGIVNLRDDGNRTAYALLVGLNDRTATLQMGGVTQTISLVSLAKLWQGDFATYWRVPAGYAGSVAEGDSGPVVEHLAAQLASLAGEPAPSGKQTMNTALRSKVSRFQSAHGIKAVGTAGPTTFMQLNRATGVDEPRLRLQTP
jgi:general secretion pathway protein A